MTEVARELLHLLAQRLCLPLLLLGPEFRFLRCLRRQISARLLGGKVLLLGREFLRELLADALLCIRVDRQRIGERLRDAVQEALEFLDLHAALRQRSDGLLLHVEIRERLERPIPGQVELFTDFLELLARLRLHLICLDICHKITPQDLSAL